MSSGGRASPSNSALRAVAFDGGHHSPNRAFGNTSQICRGGTPIARSPDVRLLFDRGTILLRDIHPSLGASDIPGVLWDPRVQACRTPAHRYQVLRGELTRRGVPFSDEVRVAQPPGGE